MVRVAARVSYAVLRTSMWACFCCRRHVRFFCVLIRVIGQACWTLSNIAAGTVEQIQTVLDSGALPSLVQLASSQPADPSGEQLVRRADLRHTKATHLAVAKQRFSSLHVGWSCSSIFSVDSCVGRL